MDFSAVVAQAKALHELGKPPLETCGATTDAEQLVEEVYGRICNSTDGNPPTTLALPSSRKTGFVFGPDSISSVILRQNAYDALRTLGFDHDFIYNDVRVDAHTNIIVLSPPTRRGWGQDYQLYTFETLTLSPPHTHTHTPTPTHTHTHRLSY